MRFSTISLAALAFAAATPAFAQDTAPANSSPATQATDSVAPAATPAPFLTVTGNATLISDYRFRGLTQTNEDPAIQATVNINSRPGFYVGTFISTIDGDSNGTTPALTNYGDLEVDLYGGFTHTFGGVGVDVGLLYYLYQVNRPSVHPDTDFFEPYASLSYTIGPVAAKVGANYSWGGQDGLNFRPNNNDDNLYVYGEGSIAVPHTPVSFKGHFGYTNGSLGLVNLNSGDDTYFDWSVTAEAVGGPLKVGVSYIDTNITSARGTYTRGPITSFGHYDQFRGFGSTVLAYVGFSF